MSTLRLILADDERIARSRLRRLLEREPDVEIVAECTDGDEVIAAVREHQPDVLFLDIQMPGKDGFAVLEALGLERRGEVIFVTAFDEHAVRAFEACALDYLLKPASPERISRALARARERLQGGSVTALPARAKPAGPHRFTVRNGGHVQFVAVEEIDWIEAAGNYAILHVGKANHMVRETMTGLESQLSAEQFLRLSRSSIVHLPRVKELYSSPTGEHYAVLHDGQRIPITRSIREVADRLASLRPST